MSLAARPTPTVASEYAFPRFERQRLSNGLGVIVAPVQKLPVVTTHIVVRAGAECDTAGSEGLASLTSQLLSEGAGALDAVRLTERMEMLGASFGTAADWDSAGVTASSLSERFEPVIELLADVVMRPTLPARELDRLRQERLAELLQLRAEPRSLADEMFTALLYARTSRYSRPLGGSERSVQSLSLPEVRAFHRDRYVPTNTTVIVAGDLAPARALAAIEGVFGDWRGDSRPGPVLQASAARTDRRVHLINKEGAPQSELRIGHVGVRRQNPDYFDLVVMNAILGGLFSSRINLNLREKHGYTYGAFSSVDWRHEAGPLAVSTAVRSDVTAESVREILSEIAMLSAAPVSQDELSLALNYLIGVFPIRFETAAAIAGALAALVVYELPDDYYDRYRAEIGLVTQESVQRAARKYLRQEELQIVMVGDAAVAGKSLREFSAAEPTVIDSSKGILD